MTLPTPASLGYRMPAEWEPHAATWLSWPHDPMTFPGRVDAAEETYREMIRALCKHERVNLLVKDDDAHERVEKWVVQESLKNVVLWDVPPADVWFRDYGPTFVKRDVTPTRSELAMTKWRFNAWGDKYESLLPDDTIPHQLQPHLGLPMFEAGIVMEGGSFEVNGRGTLMTTEQCLLNKNRNPDLSKAQIEKKLQDFLGVRHFLWLGEGIEADDTDGHVDDIARFVGPSTVVAAVEEDEDDANHAPLAANLKRLQSMKDQDGTPLTVVELPMPGYFGDEEGRLPASYANFYIANRVVLAPMFHHENDERAKRILQKVFPMRTVVPIYAGDLVYGMGTFHCVTQQQPLAVPSTP
ncbi:MAG: agmatine deiminase family protein [Candidatus Thermoplasmatota archaeon]